MFGTILALDYGTTALKAALYDEALGCMGVASREWTYSYPAPGFIEHPAEVYWEKTVSAVNELLKTTPYGLDQIALKTGFSSANLLSHEYKARFGLSPARFRRNPPQK